MLRAPGIPGALLNPRGEITTGLAILRLTGLGHPRAGLTSPLTTLRLRSEASDPGTESGRTLGSHRCAAAGKYRVELEVDDSRGESASGSVSITVDSSPVSVSSSGPND
jgi:hypothetical protein